MPNNDYFQRNGFDDFHYQLPKKEEQSKGSTPLNLIEIGIWVRQVEIKVY
jgi:hypothetical protein